MQNLRQKLISNFHFQVLICEAFRKQAWNPEKMITHPRTLERRANTPFEDLTDNELSLFCHVLKVKVADIRNPNFLFSYDGKKWQKEWVGEKGGAEV
jgi:hypothetical protein